MNERIRSV